VLARRRDWRPERLSHTDVFDPTLEDDEVITATRDMAAAPSHNVAVSSAGPPQPPSKKQGEEQESSGFFQGLMQTAADDLKLVGNVIKLALS